MGAIERLCTKAVYLSNGEVHFFGDVRGATAKYFECANAARTSWSAPEGKQAPHFQYVRLCDERGSIVSTPETNTSLTVQLSIHIPVDCSGMMLAVALKGQKGEWLMSTCPEDSGIPCPTSKGTYQYSMHCLKICSCRKRTLLHRPFTPNLSRLIDWTTCWSSAFLNARRRGILSQAIGLVNSSSLAGGSKKFFK